MSARVCPTETLCQEACVRNTGEDRPVKIGLLQRYATDTLMEAKEHPYKREKTNGKRIAIVGGGPAGLSCAHRLAMKGYSITIFDSKKKLGGLNEYGIAAYKSLENFAERETKFVLSIGGIEHKLNSTLGKDITLEELQNDYDAVFLGLGLSGVNHLMLEGEDSEAIDDAVNYIEKARSVLREEIEECYINDLEVDSELVSAYPEPGPPDQLGYNVNKMWTTNHTNETKKK